MLISFGCHDDLQKLLWPQGEMQGRDLPDLTYVGKVLSTMCWSEGVQHLSRQKAYGRRTRRPLLVCSTLREQEWEAPGRNIPKREPDAEQTTPHPLLPKLTRVIRSRNRDKCLLVTTAVASPSLVHRLTVKQTTGVAMTSSNLSLSSDCFSTVNSEEISVWGIIFFYHVIIISSFFPSLSCFFFSPFSFSFPSLFFSFPLLFLIFPLLLYTFYLAYTMCICIKESTYLHSTINHNFQEHVSVTLTKSRHWGSKHQLWTY